MTSRALRDQIRNALDFLGEAELIIYATTVALRNTRVTWHAMSTAPFGFDSYATAGQYLRWVNAGHYSAALPDGSLLQMTYDVEAGDVTGHRLAYIPCPVLVDHALLKEGEPIGDVVEVYLEGPATSAVALRSPIRFDFDPSAATTGHPAAHLTINGPECRIACVAPMHPYRFIDFVYRHFYPDLRDAQRAWFVEAERRILGARVLADHDSRTPHVTWPFR
jgi:hypothetical protein